MNYKILKTFLSIIILFILIVFSKYLNYEIKYELRNNFESFLDVPGIGGLLGVCVILFFLYYITSIWRKTKSQKIIDLGKGDELKKLDEAFKLNILNKDEYELKKNQLLKKSVEEQVKQNDLELEHDYYENEKERIEKSLKSLNDLKNENLISEKEYEEKKDELIPRKLTIEEIEKLVEICEFHKIDSEEYLNKKFYPETKDLEYEDLYYIINNQIKYRGERIYQVYIQLKNITKSSISNTN